MGWLSNISILFLALSLTLFIIQPWFAPNINILAFGEIPQIPLINLNSNQTKASRHVNMTIQAFPESFFRKWGWYPIYPPAGIILFDWVQRCFGLGVFFAALSIIKSRSSRPRKKGIFEEDESWQ